MLSAGDAGDEVISISVPRNGGALSSLLLLLTSMLFVHIDCTISHAHSAEAMLAAWLVFRSTPTSLFVICTRVGVAVPMFREASLVAGAVQFLATPVPSVISTCESTRETTTRMASVSPVVPSVAQFTSVDKTGVSLNVVHTECPHKPVFLSYHHLKKSAWLTTLWARGRPVD
jgi:hypothetical protein